MRALTYVEVDVPLFADPESEATETYRFTYDCDYLPSTIEAIPSLTGVNHSPATINLGSNLGTRASLDIQLKDHRHVFNGEAFSAGTFWGKWRGRYGTRLQGRPLRWRQGLLGQTLSQMDTRHFFIDSVDGPTPQGVYKITAKDILKFADDDRAQAPRPSSGFLVGAIDADDVAFTLSPSGIGNAEYDASGYLNLGGEEIVSFTRAGDVVTITGRAQLGTPAAAHDAGTRAQTVLRYVAQDPALIINDLFENYAGIDEGYINLASWQIETATYLQQLYTATIAEPTAVNKLVSELIEQAALAVWWDPLLQLIKLQVLRAIPTGATAFNEDNTLEGTLSIREQPTTRLSQVFTYFGQRNPLLPLDEESNFRSAALTIDGDAELAYGIPAVKKIYSRWIPFGGRTVALRLNNLQLGRFRDPPRRFGLNLFRYGPEAPELGGGYRLSAWPFQTAAGVATDAPMQITRLNPTPDRYEIEGEEVLFTHLDPVDLANRVVTIDSNIQNINLRTMHDAIYPAPDIGAIPAESLTVVIEANVVVGSDSTALPAVDVGDWPLGYPITIEVYGRIQAKGGDGGGSVAAHADDGYPGGTALYTREAIDLHINPAGGVWGGGGGGGGLAGLGGVNLGGGGGAGTLPGAGGVAADGSGAPGTATAGGDGAAAASRVAGDGGGPGQPGGAPDDATTSGGAAGAAIDGNSFVTLDDDNGVTGVLGPTVN